MHQSNSKSLWECSQHTHIWIVTPNAVVINGKHGAFCYHENIALLQQYTVHVLHQQLHQPATDSGVNNSLDFIIGAIRQVGQCPARISQDVCVIDKQQPRQHTETRGHLGEKNGTMRRGGRNWFGFGFTATFFSLDIRNFIQIVTLANYLSEIRRWVLSSAQV